MSYLTQVPILSLIYRIYKIIGLLVKGTSFMLYNHLIIVLIFILLLSLLSLLSLLATERLGCCAMLHCINVDFPNSPLALNIPSETH